MRPITINKITLHPVALEFVEPLRTSFGTDPYKVAILIQLETREGEIGWGECTLEVTPGYAYETMGTGMHILRECLVKELEGKTIDSPTDVPKLLAHTRGHPFTKHGLETAVWDAWARTNQLSLADAFSHFLPPYHTSRGFATVGVSIGIKPSV